jgi:NAD(P)-dependent dehydrogenase (short-subunit alcohol dehydrogenase family)
MPINFEVKVATVTTAGNGLGRSHALALAARGAKLLVNDLGGARDGSGANVANSDEVQEIVNQTMKKWQC